MINIAIDGPAGAGKSTIAKSIAKKLNYIYIDTGALYRSLALYISKNNIDYKNDQKYIENIKIDITFIDNSQHVILNGEDVTEYLRTEKISMLTSKISSQKYIREFLLILQRNLASRNSIVMDGRDIGTVVLPDAQIKLFISATPEKRALRRFLELSNGNKNSLYSYDEILKDINKRDYNDINREVAPLKKADTAIFIDTSELTLEQSIETTYNIILENLNIKEWNIHWITQIYIKH